MKPTLQLIAIFALALVIFVGYAEVPYDVAQALHLKQIGLGSDVEALMGGDAQSDSTQSDNGQAEPVDTASQRILLFGDSMSQLIALRLSDYANRNGHTLTCVTWNGSGTRQWAETDTLRRYMAMVRPTHVFVCLGSNELYTADMKGCRRRAELILEKIGNVPTTWVGPPNWCEDKGINDLLQTVMGKRRFFMSKGLTLPRQKDGRHPTYQGGVVWTDRLVDWMNSGQAAHPFRLEKPERRCARYRQIFIGGTNRQHGAAMPADSLGVSPDGAPSAEPLPSDAPGTQPGGDTQTPSATGGQQHAAPPTHAPSSIHSPSSTHSPSSVHAPSSSGTNVPSSSSPSPAGGTEGEAK